MKRIYRYYRDRLVEISGRSRSLYSKTISKKTAYDIGRILDGDYEAIQDFNDFLWNKKRTTYPLVDKASKERICKNLKTGDTIQAQFKDERPMKKAEVAQENQRRVRIQRDEEKKTIVGQVNDLKALKREIEEIAGETGRYELFIGYPFVEGSIGRETIIRAPLLLFPAVINIENETTAVIELKDDEQIQFNKVFIMAYAQRYNLNIDEMQQEFNTMQEMKFKNIDDIVEYLRRFGFKMSHPQRKGMFPFHKVKEPHLGDPIEVKHYAILGRFPLANAIYNDYKELDKRKGTEAIRNLIENRDAKKIKSPNTSLYTVNSLDFAQEEAIEKLNQHGNMVIYGPPGTGKSQTIVNIITDALCKNKRVLVVSQKKAALDVIYNRLGILNDKVMYVVDPEKHKNEFYARTKQTHLSIVDTPSLDQSVNNELKYTEIKQAIQNEVSSLQTISDTLFNPTPFGLSLQEMYAMSYVFGKDDKERQIYESMLKNPQIMALKFHELDNTIRIIKEKRKSDLYYKRLEMQAHNPLINHIKNDLSVHTINTVKAFIDNLSHKRIIPFNMSKYPNARQLLAFYLENDLQSKSELKPLINFIAKLEGKRPKQIAGNFEQAMEGIKAYVDEYALLETILDKKGFAMTLENILYGNALFIKMLGSALDNYVDVRDMNLNMQEMNELEMLVLNFAYKNSKGLTGFKEVVDKLLYARIYHELVLAEDIYKNRLAKIMDFDNIRNRIISLKNEQRDTVKQICLDMFKKNYSVLYKSTPENKNFFYQINKQQHLWTIRKLMETYSELMLTLFPCWLVSPENVSTIMPLKENLFDLILFDEASQIFIESTIPTIYRGRHIAIAGDNKQLRPTALFIRRYLGTDFHDLDLSTQAALEVESLLDLATSRYNSVNLNYHYRSLHEEFITFSNYAFYDCRLQIAPNLSKNIHTKPIERIKVNGTWIDRKNREEAVEIVKLLKKLLTTRKANETIGIVTFNAEQETLIEDMIDKESMKDEKFRNLLLKEKSRREDGEDVSLFVKNIENVQGDERDIIIFSIAYAANEQGKVISHFGSLNSEGGENRLNVAITRAKKKIYVVTSIEPEELSVDNAKNNGPKIFKKYLQFVRAVSDGKTSDVKYILDSFRQNDITAKPTKGIACEIKDALEKLGYSVEIDLGNNSYKLSLAVYDRKHDTYLVGIECDDAAFRSSSSVLERDVFRAAFMESRGWKILRVWSRDWWLHKQKVIAQIDKIANIERERLDKLKQKVTKPKIPTTSTNKNGAKQ
ncbi:MAG: AAA domain-containing protein [Firmicutes bacterium]|nr:AAA domain-containing protein [Bacillota bacterium]